MLVGGCLAAQAASLVALDRAREALPMATRAVTLLAKIEGGTVYLATARYARGRALAMTGRRAEGIAELERAIALFTSADELKNRAAVEAEQTLRALR